MFKLSTEEKTSTTLMMITWLYVSICMYFDKGTITYKNISFTIIALLVSLIISVLNIYFCRKYDK